MYVTCVTKSIYYDISILFMISCPAASLSSHGTIIVGKKSVTCLWRVESSLL